MKIARRPRIFYGWWLVVLSFPLNALPIAFVSFGFSFFIGPLRKEFGWTVSQIVFVLSLGRLEGGFINPVAGFLIDRWGARRIVLLGQFMAGLGLVLASRVEELWQFYAAILIAIAGSGMGSLFSLMAVLVRWFDRKRGRATAVMTTGASMGQVLLPLIAFLITTMGWRYALLTMGVTIWAVGIPLGWLIRNDPHDSGQWPDGIPPEEPSPTSPEGQPTPAAAAPASTQGMGWREAIRSQPFWMLGLATAVWSLYHGSVRVFLIPHIEAMGYSREVAGTLILTFFFIGLPGRLIIGWIADYIGPKRLFIGIFLVQSLGLVLLAVSTQWWHLFLYALTYEWAVGGYLVLQSIIIALYFGVRNFASIRGLMQVMGVAGGFLGPVVGGLVFEALGTYKPMFLTLAAVALAGVPFVLLAHRHQGAVTPA